MLGGLFYLADKYLKVAGRVLLFPFYICGKYSLEIYLFHQRLMDIVNGDKGAAIRNFLSAKLHIGAFSGWYYFLIAIVSIALAAALHELIALVTRLITKNGKKKQEHIEESVQTTSQEAIDSNTEPTVKEVTV